MSDTVETSIKFLDSVMNENSFLKGTAAVFLLKNAGIKNQTNLKHCELGVKRKTGSHPKACDSRVIFSFCIFQQLVLI